MKKYVLVIILSLAFFVNADDIGDSIISSLTVTDYSGRTVTLASPAKRVVALAPHITENVFSAGAGETLVGVAEFSDYPEQAKNILRVGNSHSFSVEALLQLEPDLVIVWSSGVSQKVIQQLISLGLNVYIDEPKRMEDVAKSINDIGVLTGTTEISTPVSQHFLQGISQLRKQYATRSPVSMFYQVWNKPLMTINGQHIISDVMRLCGGRNIFSEALATAPKINVESVLDRNPQAIVASGIADNRPEWLDEWQQWPYLQAVNHNHLFFVHPDIIQRHTLRLLQGAEALCDNLNQVRMDR